MTVLDMLKVLLGQAADELVQFLNVSAQRYPDLAPKVGELLAALQSAATQENLVLLASSLPAEIAHIAQGQLDPREHPSDAI